LRIKLFSAIILALLILIVGCSQSDDVGEASGENKKEADEQIDKTKKDEITTSDEMNDDENEDADIQDEDQKIDGKVVVKEDENVVLVELETNLIEGTVAEVNLRKAYGELSSPIGKIGSENEEIDDNGQATIEYPLDDDFFETYKGEQIEVKIEIKGSTFKENVIEAYGKNGEKFTGPFVYQFEVFEPDQRLYAPVYFIVGDEKTTYTIETPERKSLPDDYGEKDVWMEAEIIDNDHRYIYIKGESNLLEGLMLQGRYFEDEEATFSQEWATEIFIEPDGTFKLPVKYKTITSDGYIEIQGAPVRSHRTKKHVYDTYGENFEHLTGNIVKEVDDHQEILLTIDREGIDMDVPEDSLVTEDDGELRIQVPDDVLFDFDKSELKDSAKDTLDDVIDILQKLEDDKRIQINGHTDNEGDPDYNLKLSDERAASVEKYLTDNGDVNHLDIEKKGYGDTQPVESNEKEEGRQKNRRVEIVFDE